MNHTKYLLKRLIGIDIVKVFSLNALSTFVRMLAGMVSVKVVASIIGPSGIALLGQLNNFNTLLLGLANGGIQNGITKYVAEYKEEELTLKTYLSNALHITLICSSVLAILLILFCIPLSRIILLSDEYAFVFVVFGFTIILYTLNTLLISILNGFKEFKLYVRVSICGTLVGLAYSVTLVFVWGLNGALINAVTYQSVMLIVTLWMCRNLSWMKWSYFKKKISQPIVKKYIGYSLMSLTGIILAPVSQMLLRGYVITDLSATEAGIWEGMNRISAMYLSVITAAFSVYYLPRLSEINDNRELHNEIIRCFKVIIPMLLFIGSSIYLLRHFIIWLLFTPEFNAMEGLFIWQLTSDLFKMSSWMIAFVMVAKAMAKRFVFIELFFTLSYLFIAFVLLRLNGIVGLIQGSLINYVLYLIVLSVMFRNLLIIRKNNAI